MRPVAVSLFLATIMLGPGSSWANEEAGGAVAGVIPEPGARSGELNASFTLTQLVGASSAQLYRNIWPADDAIEWEIYIPDEYDDSDPAGVLVYISPSNEGSIPKHWKSLMDEHNLIWIGANNSGNRIPVDRRLVYAIMGPAVIDKSHKIDVDRVYLSGFSGGGRVASMVAVRYPHIFKGAIFNCGAEFWGREVPDGLQQVRTNAYVFITGTYDQALEPTKKAYRGFRRAGVANSKLMVIRNMTHSNPRQRDFDKAIEYLDLRGLDE